MNDEITQKWKDYFIVALLFLVIILGYSSWKQSGDYHALESELRETRSKLERALGYQREAIQQLESIRDRIGWSASEAESIGRGIEKVNERIGFDEREVARSGKLIEESLDILRRSREESEKAQGQIQ